jgi:hypothetical protein
MSLSRHVVSLSRHVMSLSSHVVSLETPALWAGSISLCLLTEFLTHPFTNLDQYSASLFVKTFSQYKRTERTMA